MDQTKKKKVLFICTHNSCRSQMAEGLLNALCGEYYETYSAGTKPSKVNPDAITVMSEIGIDISKNVSKSLDSLKNIKFDYAVTVCDNAKEICPTYFGANKLLHQSFPDPSTLDGTIDMRLDVFRKTRDDLRAWIKKTFGRY